MPEGITEFLSGGSLVALLGFIRWAFEYYRKNGKSTSSYATRQIAKIYTHLNDIVGATRANRAVILKASNGGSIPRVGSTMYSSVVYEVFGEGQLPVSHMWEKQPLDEPYMRMLSDLLTTGKVTLHTDEMTKSSLLRDVYISQKVGSSYVYLVHKNPQSIYYMSVTFPENAPKTAAERNLIRGRLVAVQNIFKESGVGH